MGFTDRLSEGLDSVAKQAQKAFEQGKTRVEQLQVERQMDQVARRLGYMEFDASRGRTVDATTKQELLAELGRLEDELHASMDAAAEAGAEPDAATESSAAATRPGALGADMAEAERIARAAAEAGVAPGTSPTQEDEGRPPEEPEERTEGTPPLV